MAKSRKSHHIQWTRRFCWWTLSVCVCALICRPQWLCERKHPQFASKSRWCRDGHRCHCLQIRLRVCTVFAALAYIGNHTVIAFVHPTIPESEMMICSVPGTACGHADMQTRSEWRCLLRGGRAIWNVTLRKNSIFFSDLFSRRERKTKQNYKFPLIDFYNEKQKNELKHHRSYTLGDPLKSLA